MLFKGIKVSVINSAGQPFVEYKDAVDFQDSDAISHCLIEVPPVGECQDFTLRYSTDNLDYFEGRHDLCLTFRCFLTETPSSYYTASGKFLDLGIEKVELKGLRQGYDPVSKEKLYTKLPFVPLEIGANENAEITETAVPRGLFDIKVWQGTKVGASVATKSCNKLEGNQNVSEKMLKGRDVSYTVSGQSLRIASRPEGMLALLKRDTKEPLHIFRFHYRTRAALISRGIIEPEIRIENPVPAPPTEKDDVRTLKAEAAKLRKEKEDLRLELESLKRKRNDSVGPQIKVEGGGRSETTRNRPIKKEKVVIDLCDD